MDASDPAEARLQAEREAIRKAGLELAIVDLTPRRVVGDVRLRLSPAVTDRGFVAGARFDSRRQNVSIVLYLLRPRALRDFFFHRIFVGL